MLERASRGLHAFFTRLLDLHENGAPKHTCTGALNFVAENRVA